MREALRYLDQIIAQTKLLCAHKIVNKEQLISIRLDWNPRYPLYRMPQASRSLKTTSLLDSLKTRIWNVFLRV